MRLHAVRSYYDNRMGLVTLEDDVLSIVRQVNEKYDGKISINLDPITGWYHFVEHGEDGVDRLIFSTEDLDHRALDRLYQADSQWRGHTDPYEAAEREQDRLKEEQDKLARERLQESAERLAHALKQGGAGERFPLQVAMPRDVDASS